ncbi:Crp/Fnr family transcriptional regulator [Polaribacter sp. Hel1_33_49]|uniref:Crp/Fnr family transcriptional regulator n=1 Tax=Polaribacter sp. Hel1_33_49 TaxID=1336803 RepID=UPI00052C3E09|nr:Crp/Fnr family transcriptional regulator [Polaribacter sp. Hel1_33_49]KGL60388.1 cyclic nucleotide-binding protein [Polaribacter sp. Hel1_33_49]
MEFLKNFFSNPNFTPIPESSFEAFSKLINIVSYEKKDTIAKTGKIATDSYIIKSGIVKSYFVDDNGKEHIRSIFTPYRSTGPLASLISNKPSELSYDCLTDCVFYQFNYKSFKELARKDMAIAGLYSEVLEFIFLKMESKIYDLSVLNATERYLKLKREIPNIEEIITQYNIASYLNITAVQLSRIRKSIYSI